MFIGNLAALVQNNVKRMLAYSSIAHAGYILVAFATSTELGIAAVLFYLAAYSLMKAGAFLVIAQLGGETKSAWTSRITPGLARSSRCSRHASLCFCSLCLACLQRRDFLASFTRSRRRWIRRLVWLVVLAAINSVIGAYYYLRVIVAMYFWDPNNEWTPAPVHAPMLIALLLAALGTLYLGILPNRVMEWALASARSLH